MTARSLRKALDGDWLDDTYKGQHGLVWVHANRETGIVNLDGDFSPDELRKLADWVEKKS